VAGFPQQIEFMKRARAVPRLAILGLAFLFAGCDDGPLRTDPALNVLQIRFAELPFEERTIAVGETVQLGAQIFDAAGKEVATSGVDWRSTNASIAQVSKTGEVKGISEGTAQIIAGAGGREDTARVNVSRPVGGLACAAEDVGLSLAVGEVYTTTGDRATALCLRAGLADTEYTLIPFNASEVAGAGMTVVLSGTGITRGAVGPPSPNRLSGRMLQPGPQPDNDFHLRMLERSRFASEPRLRAVTQMGLTPTPPRFARVPTAGDLMKLNVEVDGGDGCKDPDYRTGRVVAVTDRAVVVVDTANPKTGLNSADETELYRSFGVSFDTLVWRVDTSNFGEPTDIDKNGHVLIFFTRAVNEQTPRSNNDSFIGGYFYNRDLFANTGSNACPGSNYAEMFYMLAPDPSGTVNGHARSVPFIRNSTIGVLAHEFQHLINDSRRLYINRAPVWEESWLNEGLSHIAEELVFYEAARLSPRKNIGPAELTVPVAAQAYGEFQSPNIDRLVRYLRSPETNTLMGTDELATRGAVWSFLRYAADRDRGSETTLWNRLVKDPQSKGLENLRNALGGNPRDWMADWAVSLYTDDAGLPLEDPARHTQPSWNFRSFLPLLRVNQVPLGRYPLSTISLSSLEPTTVTLSGGGAAYLRFGAPAGSRVAVRATVRGLPAPSLLRIAIVRTR
jgi:hypothetical protein